MEEEWRDVGGWEGLYQVSNLGRVKSMNLYCHKKDVFLKPTLLKNGYLKVSFSKNGKITQYYVHRLVAEAFIPNPNNLETVNHKDENKQNNICSNLEWMSLYDNNRYGNHDKKVSQSKINNPKLCRPVICIKEGQTTRYLSAVDASRKTGVDSGSICKCCRGILNHAGGFVWKYEGE